MENEKRSSNANEYEQPISDDENTISNSDSHWLRLLARLNGNWLQ